MHIRKFTELFKAGVPTYGIIKLQLFDN